MNKIILGFFVCCTFIFSACSFIGNPEANDVSEVNLNTKYEFDKILKQKEKWKIDTYKVGDKTTFLNYKSSDDFYLSFKDEQVVGKAGCNHFFASYKIDGNRIEISNAGMTRMMCDSKLVQIEDEIIRNFTNKMSVIERLDDGSISFSNDDLYLEIK